MSDRKRIEAKIKKALKEQGTYTPALDMIITSCACSYCVMISAYSDIEDNDVTGVELSREEHETKKANPACRVFFDAHESTRKALRELGLTLSTLVSSEDDEVSDMIGAVNEVRDGR